MVKATILLAEDDPNLGVLLCDFLEIIGYRVIHAINGVEALEKFQSEEMDLCILDIMMPFKDGFTLAKEIKSKNRGMPVIFLSAKNMQEDKIKGFRIGCDDYLTKPFSTEELQLRIDAILRRCQQRDHYPGNLFEAPISIGEYIYDHANMTLDFHGEQVSLTKKEADLLYHLCQYKNQLVTREFALKQVWGNDDYFIGRSMDVFITKLRKHLKRDPRVAITNVHGVGFRLEVPGE